MQNRINIANPYNTIKNTTTLTLNFSEPYCHFIVTQASKSPQSLYIRHAQLDSVSLHLADGLSPYRFKNK